MLLWTVIVSFDNKQYGQDAPASALSVAGMCYWFISMGHWEIFVSRQSNDSFNYMTSVLNQSLYWFLLSIFTFLRNLFELYQFCLICSSTQSWWNQYENCNDFCDIDTSGPREWWWWSNTVAKELRHVWTPKARYKKIEEFERSADFYGLPNNRFARKLYAFCMDGIRVHES